jgi:hypothetical protein
LGRLAHLPQAVRAALRRIGHLAQTAIEMPQLLVALAQLSRNPLHGSHNGIQLRLAFGLDPKDQF